MVTGKLQRVEEERREYFEEISRLNDLLRSHESSARESRDTLARLQAELEASNQERAAAEEAAESRLQV